MTVRLHGVSTVKHHDGMKPENVVAQLQAEAERAGLDEDAAYELAMQFYGLSSSHLSRDEINSLKAAVGVHAKLRPGQDPGRD